jgi:hypothetical protein
MVYLFTNFPNQVRIIIFISRRTSQITSAILDVKFGLKQRENMLNSLPWDWELKSWESECE